MQFIYRVDYLCNTILNTEAVYWSENKNEILINFVIYISLTMADKPRLDDSVNFQWK